MKPLEKLTPKHRKFVKNRVAGMTIANAASMAGFAPMYGKNLVKQDLIKNALSSAMVKVGITEDLLARKLHDGLDAMAPPKRDGGKQYEDQFVRKQFLDVIFKLRGDYAPERKETTEKHITIVMDAAMLKGLKDSKVLTEDECQILDAEVVNESDTRETEVAGLLDR